MLGNARKRPDLLLLISLVLLILLHPVLDHGDFRRFILGALTFAPVMIGTLRLAQTRHWHSPALALMLGVLGFTIAANFTPNPIVGAIKWGLLALFFALAVVRLFAYLQQARAIAEAHLTTAVSIYLLLGMLWFAVYNAIEAFAPGSISHNTANPDRTSELMYFSFVTLATIGYGDVVPLSGEVRMLAALEGLVGVLYVAIAVALLVSGYQRIDRTEQNR